MLQISLLRTLRTTCYQWGVKWGLPAPLPWGRHTVRLRTERRGRAPLPLPASLWVSFSFQIPTGFSVAASVRVGNALGAGNIEQAKRSSAVALLITGAQTLRQWCAHAVCLRDPGSLQTSFFTVPFLLPFYLQDSLLSSFVSCCWAVRILWGTFSLLTGECWDFLEMWNLW